MELLICAVLILIVAYLLNPKKCSLFYCKMKQMNNNQTFNKNFVVYTLIFLLASFGIYCFVPRYLALFFSESYIKDCGQIGDVIGGTTGPLIAIAASFLTFLAFWIQYKANIQQRNDISLERFESRFYEMLRLHRENLFDLSCGENNGRDAVVGYCHKLNLIFDLVYKLPMVAWEQERLTLLRSYCNNNYNGDYDKTITVISFNLFLYGGNFVHSFEINSDERILYDAIIKEIESFESNCVSYDQNAVYGYGMVKESLMEYIINYTKDNEIPHKIEIPDRLLCGYNAKLGVYFRQLFQMIKFVSLKDGFSENERYAYVKIVRSQLSDYEQILLYYNSLAKIGVKWNQPLESPNSHRDTIWLSNMKLIARFRLIKNIPASFPMFGWLPEAEYKVEIIEYKKKDIPFFESKKEIYENDYCNVSDIYDID